MHQQQTFWWTPYGQFEPEQNQSGYPDPARVIVHYRHLAGLQQTDLAEQLNLSVRMVALMETRQDGLDLYSRRCQLAHVLKIPFVLLGLVTSLECAHEIARISTAEEPAFQELDKDGFPLPGSVVKYYRLLKTQSFHSIEKHWTQTDLAVALGISELSVRRLENQHAYLDSMSRRRALVSVLSIPAPLLGIAQREHVASEQQDPAFVPTYLSVVPQMDFFDSQHLLFEQARERLIGHNDLASLESSVHRISRFQQLEHIVSSRFKAELYALEYSYQQLVTDYLYTHGSLHIALPHLQRCYEIARVLYEKEKSPRYHAMLVDTMSNMALIYGEQKMFPLALSTIEQTSKCLTPDLPFLLQCQVRERLAHFSLYAETPSLDRRNILRQLDKVGEIFHRANDGDREQGESVYHVAYDYTFYMWKRARIFLAMRESDQALHELDVAQRLQADLFVRQQRSTNEQQSFRKLIFNIYRAVAYIQQGEYEMATHLALLLLPEAICYRSEKMLLHLAELFHRLRSTPYKNAPLLEQLGWQLGMWKNEQRPYWFLY